MNIEKILYSPNVIYLYGEVNDEMARSVVERLAELHKQWEEQGTPLNERHLVLRINSPGGSITAGYIVPDNVRITGLKVYTIAEGLAASMGAFLLAVAGTKGCRYAFRNSEVLIHQPLGGAQGQATELEIVVNRMQKVRKRLNELLAASTGKTVREIAAATDRDNWLSAQEALSFGLIDHVI